MDRDRTRELTEDDMVARLLEAAAEERDGRLVSCTTADEVRTLMAELRREHV